jgi:hypothetical protein
MILNAADGSSFSWQIANSTHGGFDASSRIERRVGDHAYLESDILYALSRDTALGWLRAEAAVRGFDGRRVR